MSKFLYALLALAFLPLVSCSDSAQTAQKPLGLESEESAMPWNRPTGPEGAGALGILDRR